MGSQKRATELTLEAEEALRKKDWASCNDLTHAAWLTDAGDRGRLSQIASACLEGEEREEGIGKSKPSDAGARQRKSGGGASFRR